ncbi:hypothetical protein C900_00744 [Fulvivirga imtechensis AK7]|uniref:Uncharacterized protein n=1 Tax=Fulvivirga imtechensis AK7 TaxID=1237149 RepID=L8JX83_9BACT|nr:hypothetical protein C900_00744 [Fulvivirga imtechensis AK7]
MSQRKFKLVYKSIYVRKKQDWIFLWIINSPFLLKYWPWTINADAM